MANSFYRDDDGFWWINNKVVVPSRDFSFQVDDKAAPTLFTLKGATNYFFEKDWTSVVIADIEDESGTPYGNWAAFKEGVRDFFTRAGLQQAGVNLNGVGTQTIADADTWTEISPVGATFEISEDAKGFYRDITESEIVHTGLNGTNYLFSGSTDLKSSANTVVEFALIKNDDLLNPIAVSQHTFGAAQSIENFSINKDVKFNTGDRLNLYARVGANNTTLTIYSLNTSYWGDR